VLPVAVLVGGLGSRLREVTGDSLPKALVPVNGRPFIDLKLAQLREQGAERVVMLIGYGGEAIRRHLGRAALGLSITYLDEGATLLGTGGAVLRALPRLGEAFWVTYGDTLLSVDVPTAEASFLAGDALGLMTVYRNENRLEPSNTRVQDSLVVAYGKHPRPPGARHIDYGMLAFRRETFAGRVDGEAFDLADVLQSLVARGQLVAFEVAERFHDIGTPAALRETERFVARFADPSGDG
jgi:NDP-sugar pyrophosphorylase family protein